MRAIVLVLCMLFFSQSYAQHYHNEKVEINKVVQKFAQSIINKDSTMFYSLFHEHPIVWIGLVKDKTQHKRLERNPGNTKNFFPDDYRNFFNYILEKGNKEEKFEKIKIDNDDVVASVHFDYSFWEKGEMTNWGKELWHLIKADGKWKITSVVYSYELAERYP